MDRKAEDPYIFTLVLKPVPEAIKEARDVIGFAFGHWGLKHYTARLVVSELVTNAMRASTDGQYIAVRAYLMDDGTPVIEVWDESDELPTPQAASLTDENGRGLFIIDAFVARWGTRPLVDGGKVMWAHFEPVTA